MPKTDLAQLVHERLRRRAITRTQKLTPKQRRHVLVVMTLKSPLHGLLLLNKYIGPITSSGGAWLVTHQKMYRSPEVRGSTNAEWELMSPEDASRIAEYILRNTLQLVLPLSLP